MDAAWLKDFLELYERGSFSRAAEGRNVSQPAFSRRIRMLEEWAETDLFDRRSHPVALSAAGQEFLPHARDILTRIEEARQVARNAGEEAKGTLHFATTQVLSLTFFPSWLRSILSHIRLGTINLKTDSLLACEIEMLQQGSQFLLCHYYPGMTWRLAEDQFTSVTIEQDRLLPVSAPDADGKALYHLDRSTEGTLPFLSYDTDAGLGRIFRSVFSADEMKPGLDVVAVSHLALLLGLALEGRGIAWVPESVVRHELSAGVLVEAGESKWSIPMEIRLFRPFSSLGAAAENFWNYVVEQ
jgi:DNA-binding transcriptional LysR family regulator